jgi:prevent-host-death family protein
MSIPSVPLAEASIKLSELVDRVSRGEEFIITRHDAAIVRLVPANRIRRMEVAEAIAQMRAQGPRQPSRWRATMG